MKPLYFLTHEDDPWMFSGYGIPISQGKSHLAGMLMIDRPSRCPESYIQYRDYDGEMTCLKCYQDLIIENGVEREKLEEGFIPGMFFSWGNLEPIQAGYREVNGFKNYYVAGKSTADAFRKKALELLDQGKLVVIGYESLGIGGGEGYVTLMEKDRKIPRKRRAKHGL